MTEIAYMTREDWAQEAAAMVPQSAVIRDWLGKAPHLFAVADPAYVHKKPQSIDRETLQYIAPTAESRHIVSIAQLRSLGADGATYDHAIAILHPHDDTNADAVREFLTAGTFSRALVMVWHGEQLFRTCHDGMHALDLHTGTTTDPIAPVMIEAARMIKNEDYNGLSSGHGKDATVQLLRVFGENGYPIEREPWLRAYFSVGGSIRHAQTIAKLIEEMRRGVRHRVERHYRDDIFAILKGHGA
jgi:hypothetical protein